MKRIQHALIGILATIALFTNCSPSPDQKTYDREADIVFLHHSTGSNVWGGGVPQWFDAYNAAHTTGFSIVEVAYPNGMDYLWENYPYDYWNIWVNHAGQTPYVNQNTLEILTQKYRIVVFKHCFPVSGIEADTGSPDVTSPTKSIENYQLQYNALKQKMHFYPNNLFIVWTGAALVEAETTPEAAQRSRDFFTWVKTTWDDPGDNIYIWDFFELETEGGNYILPQYAVGANDAHPNSEFCETVAPYFCNRVINVIKGMGDSTSITGI